MRITVNPEHSQGYALCPTAVPELVDFDDEAGHALRAQEAVPPGGEAAARRAAAACPERAITVRD